MTLFPHRPSVLLREHTRGIHTELERLIRGIEVALDMHLTAITEALSTCDRRLTLLEDRITALEDER